MTLTFLALGVAGNGQTVLIDAAGDGGFVNPGGFAGNNWQVDNGIATNQWHVGTVPISFPTASAFVSNNGGATHGYTNTASSVVHFWKDVTFPAGETSINLSFQWQALGEASFWDGILVSIAPTTYIPTASTTSIGTGVLAAPAINIASLWGSAGVQTANISMPASLIGNCSAAQTWRVIFTWKNDGSLGTNPPAAIDNISLTSAAPLYSAAASPFTIDNTLPNTGNNFSSFTAAINWLNAVSSCNLINNPIVFNVAAGQTFNELPPAITATGTSVNTITFQRSGVGNNPILRGANGVGGVDGGIVISGGDYFTFNGIDIQDNPSNTTTTTQLEYGYLIRNASATNGATNNTITNCAITLNRTNTASRAIFQTATTTAGGFTPTASSGANSNNTYNNVAISNVYGGIFLTGTAAFPDAQCLIQGNTIGSTTANDIGGAGTATAGIRVENQNNVTVHSNLIQNVATSAAQGDGINVVAAQGTTVVSNNIIRTVRNISTTSTTVVAGIRATINGTGTHETRIFNNFVSGVGTAYTGTITSTRIARGIFIPTGGAATSTHNIHFNSVSMDGTANPNASNTAFEIGTTSGPIMSIRNNIFANFTGAQTGAAAHYTWVSTSATVTGNTGSVSNNNDLYIANTTNGFVGLGNTTQYATLANWQAATTQDAASVSADPQFTNNLTDLHTFSVNVNGLADMTGITWVSTDIDNQTRVAPHDIGADDFTPPSLDLGIQLMVTPTTSGCRTGAEPVIVRVRNYGATPIDFSVTNATVTVNITGALTQTLTFTLTNNSLNSGNPLSPSATIDVPMGNINMSATGTYIFNSFTSAVGDGNALNDAMAAVNVTLSGGNFVAAGGGRICLGDGASLTVTGFTNGGTIQWQESPDGLSWTNIPGATTATFAVVPTDTTWYRAEICGVHFSTIDTIFPQFVAPPVALGDTICGVDTAYLSATGNGIRWYDAPTGGNQVGSGNNYNVYLNATDTFYVAASSGTPPTSLTTTFASGNGAAGNAFRISALNTITITGFDGHMTSGTANWEIWGRPGDYTLVPGSTTSNAGWTLLGSATGVVAAGLGVPTPLPITINVTIPSGTDYSFIVTTTGPTVNYTNGTLLNSPFTTNADLIFRQGHGGGYFSYTNQPRVFNGNIRYSSGCESARTQVIAVVDPAPAFTLTSSNNICGSGTSTLTAASANSGYAYTWSPSASLSAATGDTVVASPTTTTNYFVVAEDAITGCRDTSSITVLFDTPPAFVVSAAPDTICSGSTTQLDVSFSGPNPVIVGTSNTLNTATSYPAPYGNFWWGSRHQMLITAADLNAAGLTAGYISALSFEVNNPNATQALDNFEIKLGTTTLGAITTFQTTPMTTVFTTPSHLPVNGVNTHTFQTLFYWDGVSNLLVETCHQNSSFTDNATMRQTPTAYNSTVWYNADATGVCGNNTTNGFAAQRPNMRFWRSNGAWEYAWSPANTLSNSTIQDPIASPLATGYYTVTVTDSISGCVSVDSVEIFVNQSPAPNFGPDTAICNNAPLVLDGTAGSYTYLWQDNSTNQTFTVSSFGIYNVFVNDTVTGCTGTDTILVGINPAPVFTLGSDAAVCAGSNVTFTGPGGPYDYDWNTGDSVIAITVNTTGNYILVVTDTVNGCSAADTVVFTANPLPVVTLGADTSYCSNNAIVLTGPAGNFTYVWSDNSTNDSLSVSSTGTYFVTVTDTATTCFNADTVTIVINATPVVALGADTTFCSANGPLTLNAPAGPYNYLWSDNSNGVSLAVNSSGTYAVAVTDSVNGCSTNDSINVVVNASPNAVLVDTSSCGNGIILTAAGGNYTYLWSDNTTGQSTTVTVSGNVSVVVTDTANGCAITDAAIVNINTPPTATVTASAANVCADDANVTLTGAPAGGVFVGTSVTGNAFDPSVGAGSYAVDYIYTDANGCTDTATTTIVVSACVGVEEAFFGVGMNVYPNPNNGQFIFTCSDANFATMTFEVISMDGKVVLAEQASNVQGQYRRDMNMYNLANGVYYFRVIADGQTYMQKIVKQD